VQTCALPISPALLIDSAAAGAPQRNCVVVESIQLRGGTVVESRGWLAARGAEIKLDRLRPHKVEIGVVVQISLLQIGQNLEQGSRLLGRIALDRCRGTVDVVHAAAGAMRRKYLKRVFEIVNRDRHL